MLEEAVEEADAGDLDTGALKFGAFTLKSGRASPYFFNAGKVCDGPNVLSLFEAYAAAIVASGALMPLVSTLSSPDFLCQRYAAMGIGNLATNMANQERILQEGALQPLISLSRRDNGVPLALEDRKSVV